MFKLTHDDETVTVTFTVLRHHKAVCRGKHATVPVDRARYVEEAWIRLFEYGERKRYADGSPTTDSDGKALTEAGLNEASRLHAEGRRDSNYGLREWNLNTYTRLDPVVKEARSLAITKVKSLAAKPSKALTGAQSFEAILVACADLGVTIDADALRTHAERLVDMANEVTF